MAGVRHSERGCRTVVGLMTIEWKYNVKGPFPLTFYLYSQLIVCLHPHVYLNFISKSDKSITQGRCSHISPSDPDADMTSPFFNFL